MPADEFSDHQLADYLDELLPAEEMTVIEKALRESESLRRRVSSVSRKHDQGLHSVGAIWRRQRLSCPSRSQLGSFLLGTLDDELTSYIDFHIRTVGCRLCAANLNDLEKASEQAGDAPERRQRFFQSSAGYLPKSK